MGKTKIFRVLILSFLGSNIQVSATKHQKNLYQHLFSGYDARIRPVQEENSAVNMTLRMNIYQLVEIKEKAQHIKVSGWINQKWQDAYLSWRPENFGGIRRINIKPSLIWKPDIVLYNNVDEDLAAYGGNMDTLKTRIIVDYNGNVYWFAPVILRAQCTINVAQFPFDSQQCFFKFGSATYDMKEVNVFGKDVDIRNYASNQEWKLLTRYTVRSSVEYACCPGTLFPDVTFHFEFQRRSLFYVVNLIFPIVFITLLTIWIFNLPAQSGERMSVGVTLLLAVTVFMMLVTEMIPESSESIPVAGVFIIFCLAIMFFIIIAVGFVNTVYNRTIRDKEMGIWTRLIFLENLSYLVRARHKSQDNANPRITNGTAKFACYPIAAAGVNIISPSCNRSQNHVAPLSQIVMQRNMRKMEQRMITQAEEREGKGAKRMQKLQEENEDSTRKIDGVDSWRRRVSFKITPEEEWQIVGKTLDRCFFIFFMFTFVFGCIWCFGGTTYHH